MISHNLQKLSQIIDSDSKSFSCSNIDTHRIRVQIDGLRKHSAIVYLIFQEFKNNTNSFLKQWMGKICTFAYKLVKQKNYFENELEKSQKIQVNMKNEVIQLKEMIQQAMTDYQSQLDSKNKQIKNLLEQLQMMKTISSAHNITRRQQQQIKIQQSRRTERQSQLQIIQEQSSHITYSSSVASLRDQKEEKVMKSIDDISQSNIVSIVNKESIDKVKKEANIKHLQSVNSQNKYQNKTIKTFIDHFRKTIEESFSENHQKEPQYNFKKNSTQKEPLKDISCEHNQVQIHNKYYTEGLKPTQKENYQKHSRVYSISQEYNNGLSSSSSQSDLIVNGDSQKINLPKKFEIAANKMFARKREPEFVSRIKTQPSPQTKQHPCSIAFGSKGTLSHKKIFGDKKGAERSSSNQDKSCNKSIKSSFSKEKIKITSKMNDETSYGSRKFNNSGKAFVYLGGKSIFRKFLTDLKASFKKYVINVGLIQNEIYYEGQKKNGLRSGKGCLFYKNGIIYEGMFRQNIKHGKGSISMNGICIYQGQWCNDKLQGQGYIKSMKYMSESCSSIFNESSYLGNFYDNKLHGVGTIFLNPKEKIVTKFIHGMPVGDLTYYNLHEIEFGVWPTQ